MASTNKDNRTLYIVSLAQHWREEAGVQVARTVSFAYSIRASSAILAAIGVFRLYPPVAKFAIGEMSVCLAKAGRLDAATHYFETKDIVKLATDGIDREATV
jgi:hypothetical protein